MGQVDEAALWLTQHSSPVKGNAKQRRVRTSSSRFSVGSEYGQGIEDPFLGGEIEEEDEKEEGK